MRLQLIGFPVKHSFSADYFAEKFHREGINGSYILRPVKDLSGFINNLMANGGVDGFNVTIPHKKAIMDYLDSISQDAKEIGAVNTVKIHKGNDSQIITLSGYNTDYTGFRDSLQPIITQSDNRALVLGYGGSARAVIYALLQLGIEPTVVSRKYADVREEHMCGNKLRIIGYQDLTPDEMHSNQLIINTTPLGMWPDTDRCPDIPWKYVNSKHLCYDLIYNPEKTKFLDKADKCGARTKNGLEMLHRQAEAAWNIWTDPVK